VSNTIKNLTLKIWRQDNPNTQGRFEIHRINEITDEASFLEMLDILTTIVVKASAEPVR
jgi:succinate dehydrogenase / fumarate reductase iron-sulfur subunit